MSVTLLSNDVEPATPIPALHQLYGTSPIGHPHPRFSATVPREFVHRASVAEVLLTGWLPLEDDRFLAAAQWPRAHSYFTSTCGMRYDPTLIAETVRQLGTLLAHAEYEVPLDSHFLMSELRFSCDPGQLRVLGKPAELSLAAGISGIRRSGRQLSAFDVDVEIVRDGRPVGSGHAKASILRPGVYRRLRAGRSAPEPEAAGPLPEPVAPALVDRRYAPDVVLSPGGEPGRWLLRADQRHPILFEHPNDHIPGMVMLEAARQIALLLVPGGTAVEAENSFLRYVEFDSPCVIEAEERPAADPAHTAVHVRAEQDGRTVFTSTMTLARPDTAVRRAS